MFTLGLSVGEKYVGAGEYVMICVYVQKTNISRFPQRKQYRDRISLAIFLYLQFIVLNISYSLN